MSRNIATCLGTSILIIALFTILLFQHNEWNRNSITSDNGVAVVESTLRSDSTTTTNTKNDELWKNNMDLRLNQLQSALEKLTTTTTTNPNQQRTTNDDGDIATIKQRLSKLEVKINDLTTSINNHRLPNSTTTDGTNGEEPNNNNNNNVVSDFCRLADFSRGTYHSAARRFVPTCQLEFKYTSNCFKRIKYVVVMGDSQSFHLAQAIRKGLLNVIRPTLLRESEQQHAGVPMACNTLKNGAKCGEEKTYYNFKPSLVLKPQCKSCNGCTSFLDGCGTENIATRPNAAIAHKLEYLAVEQLLDSQMPSALFNTTQENVLEYLSRPRADGKPAQAPDLFLFNAGAHMQVEQTLEQVQQYFRPQLIKMFQELKRLFPGTTIVWIATNYIEKNVEIGEYMYQAAKKTAEQNAIPFLDVYNISIQVPHLYSDLVHLHHENEIYYHTIRDIIFSWYCSSSKGF
jgi:hypothetical protein